MTIYGHKRYGGDLNSLCDDDHTLMLEVKELNSFEVK